MEQSLFKNWIAEYMPQLVLRVVEKYNDEAQMPTYLFKQFLTKKFSVDGRWTSLSVNNQLVVADVVAMDSSIPLKARASLGKATGDIPKMAMEFQIREQELTELDTLIALGQNDQALQKLFSDIPMVIGGQYERLEAQFLELASSGVCEYDQTETVGTAVRIDVGFLAENKFDASLAWSNPLATPITDIQTVVDKVQTDGKVVTKAMMDRATFNKLKNSEEGKSLYASFIGNFGNALTTPSQNQFISAFRDDLGFDIVIIERSVVLQRDGVNTTVKPWKAGSVTLITSDNLGSYVWATLAEKNNPVAGVSYETADDFILVSKFRMNRPSLMEVTNSQSRVCAVLDNVDSIYLLNTIVA
mgnify:CR=1 FL=1